MSSALGNLDTGDAKIEDKDVVGNNYGVLESSIYPFFIEEAFIETTKSGSMGVHFTFKENQDGTGKVLEKTIYIQSSTAKGGKSYYTDKEGKQQPLPGYLAVDSLCKIITGKGLTEMSTTKMAAQVYDADAKKRVTTQVDMIKSLLKHPVYVAVKKLIVDKQVKNDAGEYVAAGGTREENDIVKFFRAADKKSLVEIEANNDKEAAFYHTWLKEWHEKTHDRSSAKNKAAPAGANAQSGASGMFT